MTSLKIGAASSFAGALFSVFCISGVASADGTLHIYNFSDYTSPELVKAFEQKYDVKVTVDTFDSSEAMLAKLKSGATGYDIVITADYIIPILIKEGYLKKVEVNKLDNFKNILPQFVDVYWDKGREYTAPWQWGSTGVSVNTKFYSGDINSWAILFKTPSELQGKVNVLLEMNDVINAALFYLGLDKCNSNLDDLKKVNDLLVASKPNWRSFGSDTYEKLSSRDVYASQNWNGYSLRARQEMPEILYGLPKEGMVAWADNAAILESSNSVENAKLFMNFIMAPENAAMMTKFSYYANAIKGSEAFMPTEIATAPELVPPATAPTPEFIPPCDQKVVELYTKIWNGLLQ